MKKNNLNNSFLKKLRVCPIVTFYIFTINHDLKKYRDKYVFVFRDGWMDYREKFPGHYQATKIYNIFIFIQTINCAYKSIRNNNIIVLYIKSNTQIYGLY